MPAERIAYDLNIYRGRSSSCAPLTWQLSRQQDNRREVGRSSTPFPGGNLAPKVRTPEAFATRFWYSMRGAHEPSRL
jgi:hypothetical protein